MPARQQKNLRSKRKNRALRDPVFRLFPVQSTGIIPVLLWGTAFVFLENLSEITLGGIVEKGGDLGEGIVGTLQQIFCLPQFFPMNIFRDSHAQLFFELEGEAAGTQPAVAGQIFHTQFFVQMLGIYSVQARTGGL